MTKPKTLDQLRAEKERAETQLAQERHKLERLENRKKYLEQGIQAATSAEAKKITQPIGAATPEKADTRHRRASAFSGCPFGGDFAGSAKPHCGRWRGHPLFHRVSRCVRSFSERRVCVPTFTRESEHGPFAPEVLKAV